MAGGYGGNELVVNELIEASIISILGLSLRAIDDSSRGSCTLVGRSTQTRFQLPSARPEIFVDVDCFQTLRINIHLSAGTKLMGKRSPRLAHLVFIDECGFMLEPTLRRTWAPRGQTPVIKIADRHGRISAAGALTISPVRTKFGFYFHLLPDNANFRGNSIAGFVDSVRLRIGGPLIVIWDQIPIHQSYPVKHYVRQHDDVSVEQFPPYAPELNPVDYVWAYVKYGRLANYCPKNLDELRIKVSSELSRVSARPDLLKSFFHATGLEL